MLVCILEPNAPQGLLPIYYRTIYILFHTPPSENCPTDATSDYSDLRVILMYDVRPVGLCHLGTTITDLGRCASFETGVTSGPLHQSGTLLCLDRQRFRNDALVRPQYRHYLGHVSGT